ncbi:PAS domain S-box protein [Leptolyngbyaceae cyanobacterium UHCC 1019]
MKKLSEKVVTGGFALSMLLLSGVGAESYLQVRQLNENRRSVQHTHKVLESIYMALDSVEDAGKGQRSYVFSNGEDAAAREEFWNSVKKRERSLAQVRQLTQDNPDQQRYLNTLEPLIAKRLILLQQSINLVQQNPADQATQTAISKQSLSLHREIESKLQAMITVERTLLQQRSAATDRSVKRALWISGIGNALGFSLLIGIFSLLLHQIREAKRDEVVRYRAEMALQQANDRLEANVEKRTLELAQANLSLQTELTERQLAVRALLDSEKQLRLITDALPVLISYIDSEQRYRFNNKTYEEWFGSSQKDLTGRLLKDVVGESAYQTIRHYAEAVLAGQTVSYESLISYQTGGDRWVHVTYIPDFDEQKTVKGYFALVDDISDRKQTEVSLRQSEEHLHRILQNMPVMLDAFDDNWNLIEWNRECERVTGYRADEVVGNSQVMELLYPNLEYRQRMIQAWRDRGNDYRQWEWEVTCKDGTIKTISWSSISDQCPTPGWAFWGIGVDVTDRKAAQQEVVQLNQSLNHQIRQLETLLEVIPIGIGIAQDPECKHIKVNPAFAKQLGIPTTINASLSTPPKESPTFKVYQNGREMIPEELPMQYAAAHGAVVMDVEIDVVHENGKVVTLLEYAAPLFDEQNQIIGCVGAFLDISERTQLQAALQQMNEALEIKVQERTAELNQVNEDLTRSNQELEQFAYVASHDLQEPLRAISGYTQLLAKDYLNQLDATGQQYTAYVVEGAARMQQLIQDLLDYSRIGTRDLVLTAVDSNAVLNRVLDNLQLAIAESNAIITHDPLPTVTADKTQLIQLFQNLIGNAIKFRRESPPQIHISATWDNSNGRSHRSDPHPPNPEPTDPIPATEVVYLFAIRDNGIGIKPRYLERIFEIFKRLHTRREFPGTGIGLAICKKIVDRHNGRIWAESEPDIGTTFYFTLPQPPTPASSYGSPNPQLNRDSID